MPLLPTRSSDNVEESTHDRVAPANALSWADLGLKATKVRWVRTSHSVHLMPGSCSLRVDLPDVVVLILPYCTVLVQAVLFWRMLHSIMGGGLKWATCDCPGWKASMFVQRVLRLPICCARAACV